MDVPREAMTLGVFSRKCIRCCDRLGDQEEVPQNNTMLEKQSLPGPPNIHPEIAKDVMKYTN